MSEIKGCMNCGNISCPNNKKRDCVGCGRYISPEDKIKEYEAKNAELKADNDARKFAMAMSEKVEKQLREENAELKERLNIRSCQNCKRNNKSCPNDGSCKNYSKWKGYENPQLTKAKEIIKDFLLMAKVERLKDRYETVEEAEQFLNSEVEK